MLQTKLNKYDIILASGSPRRKQLMDELGISCSVAPVHIDESFPERLSPIEAAEYLSERKAEACSLDGLPDHVLVITADTIVTQGGEILGKPTSRDEAISILTKLSGKTHQVITGVTLKTKFRQHTFSVATDVTFKILSPGEMSYYIDTFRPYDKAGAYGIQEWIGHVAIEHIEGSYFNVMGLPTHRLYEELDLFIEEGN